MSDWIGTVGIVLVIVINAYGWWRTFHPEPLIAGKCECGHHRCAHKGGKRDCVVTYPQGTCACQMYIPISGEDRIAQTELQRLRKMAGLDK